MDWVHEPLHEYVITFLPKHHILNLWPLGQAPDQNAPEPEVVPENPDPEKLFSVHVSIRSFIKFLNSHVVSTTTIACTWHFYCACLRTSYRC